MNLWYYLIWSSLEVSDILFSVRSSWEKNSSLVSKKNKTIKYELTYI